MSAVNLFEASMEFLENTDDDDDEDTLSFVGASFLPTLPSATLETLPMCYDHTHRAEQADVVAMGGRPSAIGSFDSAFRDHYALRLRGIFYFTS